MICNCNRLDGLISVVHIILSSSFMSDGDNYFEFHDEESKCPTEFSEETVLTSATASECATASANVTMATSRPTRTLAKKANCSISFGIFFSILTQIQVDTLLTTERLLLRLVNSERRNCTAQCAFPVSR